MLHLSLDVSTFSVWHLSSYCDRALDGVRYSRDVCSEATYIPQVYERLQCITLCNWFRIHSLTNGGLEFFIKLQLYVH